MTNTKNPFRWEIDDIVVNFTNYKMQIKKRFVDEDGKNYYLVETADEIDLDQGIEDKTWTIAEDEIMCYECDYEYFDEERLGSMTENEDFVEWLETRFSETSKDKSLDELAKFTFGSIKNCLTEWFDRKYFQRP